MLDITKNKDIHGGDLEKVTDFLPGSTSADSSYDAESLFVSNCPPGSNTTCTITSQPATGGERETIYANLQGNILDLRAISDTNLLFVHSIPGGDFGKVVLTFADIHCCFAAQSCTI